jgi:flagellar motor component MotA
MRTEKRDYLMQQIEQMGQVLAQMLAYLLGLKRTGLTSLSLDEIRQNYDDRLNLPLDLILETPGEKIIQLLTEKVKYMDRHLEKMANVLSETADLYDETGDHDTARELWGDAKDFTASGQEINITTPVEKRMGDKT